eukprot:scaffold6778_cov115-Skeletonema_marinoi.AAC.8
MDMQERVALESEIIRKCLSRSELQCSFLEYRGFKVIYRRYASLFFIVGTKADFDVRVKGIASDSDNYENELGMLEFIHILVETMDRWAGSICELDIMYQLEQVHFLLDEMVMNGYVIDTNKSNILRSIDLIEREGSKNEGMFRNCCPCIKNLESVERWQGLGCDRTWNWSSKLGSSKRSKQAKQDYRISLKVL